MIAGSEIEDGRVTSSVPVALHVWHCDTHLTPRIRQWQTGRTLLESATTTRGVTVTRRRLQNAGLGLLVFALLSGWPHAWQRAAAVAGARAGSALPAGLAVRPAARIQDRARHAGRQDRVLHRRHLRQPRPAGRVAEQLGQRQRRRACCSTTNGDGIFESREDRLRQAQHLSRPVLRRPRRSTRTAAASIAGRSRRRRPPAPGADRRQARRRPRQSGDPTIGIPGLYKLEDTNGDDVMDTIERIQRYTSAGMGDHGPHAIRRAPGRLDHVPDRQQHLRRRAAGQRRRRGQGSLAQLEQRQGAAVPAAVQRSALRQQHADRRARDGVAAAAEQQVRAAVQRHAQSRTTSPTTSPARRSRSTATWNGTSTRRGTAKCAPST